jgi:ATP-dependent Clp protease ATP-binding subunit ClpC
VDAVRAFLCGAPRRSVVLVGESGVGKTVLTSLVVDRLVAEGWTVFEAGYSELTANMSYIGEFEGRIQRLLREIGRGRKAVWVIPDLAAMLWAGRHRYGPVGALDILLPVIERGELLVLAESRPAEFERLLLERPAHPDEPAGAARGVALRGRDAGAGAALGRVLCVGRPCPGVQREALQLARQFLGDKALPGGLMQALDRTRQRLASAATGDPPPMQLDDLILTFSEMTGLPAAILDERQGLDLAALRRLFESRVLGQPEAVDCLVERLAMIKAGVTEASRRWACSSSPGPRARARRRSRRRWRSSCSARPAG